MSVERDSPLPPLPPAPFFFFLMLRPPPRSTLFPYTTLFRSLHPVSHSDFVERLLDALLALGGRRSEEHTSELQSPYDLVCRLLLEKKKKKQYIIPVAPHPWLPCHPLYVFRSPAATPLDLLLP